MERIEREEERGDAQATSTPHPVPPGGLPFSCPGVEVVSREGWGARTPKASPTPIPTPLGMVFLHHSAGGARWACNDKKSCIKAVRDIQDFHMDDRGWDDIGYSFLVGGDGRVYVGRGWGVQGAHTLGYNRLAHGICIMGDYNATLPDKAALRATHKLFACGVRNGYTKCDYELFGHRDGRCTECPGDALYRLMRTWPQYSTREIHRYC